MYGMYGCTEMKTGVYGWDGMYSPSPRVYGLRKFVSQECTELRKLASTIKKIAYILLD